MPIPSTKSPKASSPIRRTSRTITISLPADMAAKAEALAKREGRTMSELFREAFRTYHGKLVDSWFDELRAYATTNPRGYTEEDIPRLIKEVRAETISEKTAQMNAKAS